MIIDDAVPLVMNAPATSTAELLDRIAGRRLLAAALPVAVGGEGLGAPKHFRRLLDLLRKIGAEDLAAGRIFEGHVNALALIGQHATPEQQARWTRDVLAGRWFGVWNTDAETPVAMECAGDRVTLRGAKIFCSGAGRVDRALITAAAPNGGRAMIIVPMENLTEKRIDRESWKPLGMQTSDSFAVDFSGIDLSSDDVLGTVDAYLEEPWFNGGAIRFAAVQLGGAERLASESAAYLRSRGRTGDPFQQQRAGESAVALEGGRLWLASAAGYLDRAAQNEPLSGPELIRYARMTRTAIESCAQRVLRDVERTVGAFGLLEPLPFARFHRDLTMYLRQPAPDATLLAIGKETLEM